MKADRIKRLLERWEDLDAKRERLEFEWCVLMRDIRSMFPSGDDVEAGDEEMLSFCAKYRDVQGIRAKELLSYAIAGAVFTDPDRLRACGGVKQIRNLALMPRKAQATLMMKARAEVKNINTVIRERGPERETNRAMPARDAEALAKFINSHVKDVPPPIRAIVARYVKLKAQS